MKNFFVIILLFIYMIVVTQVLFSYYTSKGVSKEQLVKGITFIYEKSKIKHVGDVLRNTNTDSSSTLRRDTVTILKLQKIK